MGERKDRMFIPHGTKDVLDTLVTKICETHGLEESTVRDMLSKGWQYHDNKWVKQGSVVILNPKIGKENG